MRWKDASILTSESYLLKVGCHKLKGMQEQKALREVSVQEWRRSRTNLIIPLSFPYGSPWAGGDTERRTKGVLAALFQACTRSQKKLLKSWWRRGPLHTCRYQLHSIKTYGIKHILLRAEQNMLRFSVWWVGGWEGEGQMASITRHIALKLLEQSISSEPRNYISFPQRVS